MIKRRYVLTADQRPIAFSNNLTFLKQKTKHPSTIGVYFIIYDIWHNDRIVWAWDSFEEDGIMN